MYVKEVVLKYVVLPVTNDNPGSGNYHHGQSDMSPRGVTATPWGPTQERSETTDVVSSRTNYSVVVSPLRVGHHEMILFYYDSKVLKSYTYYYSNSYRLDNRYP